MGTKNNMSFKNNKFELLQYGLNSPIKESTPYFAPDGTVVIEGKDHVKDLAVIMSSSGTFS